MFWTVSPDRVARPLILSAPDAPIVVTEYSELAEREFRIIAEESVDTPETLRAFWIWAADRVERPLILSPPAAPIVVTE